MNIQEIAKTLFSHKTVRPTYVLIPDTHVDVPIDKSPITPNESYFEVRIQDMFLATDRKLYITRYPALQAVVQSLGEGEQTTAFCLDGPQQLDKLSGDRRRIITRNHRIIGPLPYFGDDVELLLGLLAIEGDNLLETVLNTLSNVSKIIGIGQVTLALHLAEAVKQGFDDLLKLKDAELCIGVYERLSPRVAPSSASALQCGYRLVATIASDKLVREQLWVRDGRLYVGPRMEEARQPEDFDYFLFTVDKLSTREDWSSIPSIGPSIKKFNQLLASSTSEVEIRNQFELFKGVVLSSSDLVFPDKVKIIQGICKRAQDVVELRREGLTDITFLGEKDIPSHDDLVGPLGDLRGIMRATEAKQDITITDLINIHL